MHQCNRAGQVATGHLSCPQLASLQAHLLRRVRRGSLDGKRKKLVTDSCDTVVIGGGIVGLSTALALSNRYPDEQIVLLEKEGRVAAHQTGHNSGVVHSGIYYKPGSLKASLARAGAQKLREFCAEHELPYEECGKVIVATDSSEVPRLKQLFERGVANGVPGLRLIDANELRVIEPHAQGVQAIHSPTTAITDFVAVCTRLEEILTARGLRILTSRQVTSIERGSNGLHVRTQGHVVSAKRVINCAGLHSDKVAKLAGSRPQLRIIPFRGEYYVLKGSSNHLVNGLIYPVPDPAMPFLGVHFTRMINGGVEAGPNAIMALAREGYGRSDVRIADVLDSFGYGGFWKLAQKYWRVGVFEVYRSLSKRQFVRSLRKLVPDIEPDDLSRGPSGVRAQAVDFGGNLVDDFVMNHDSNVINVLNAPSPAATAGLAIGEHLVSKLT